MTTLTIKDLSAAETLDSKRMHAVRGGLAYLPFAAVYAPIKLKLDSSIDATQSIARCAPSRRKNRSWLNVARCQSGSLARWHPSHAVENPAETWSGCFADW